MKTFIEHLNESKSDFNPSDEGMNGLATLYSKDGEAYICYNDDDGSFIANHTLDDYQTEKVYRTLKIAARVLYKKRHREFDQKSYKAMLKYVYGKIIPIDEN